MIIARAPVRISLAGGGTDLPAYYEKFGGAVVSTAIDKYFYVVLNVTEDDSLQISSSDYRTFYRHDGEEPVLWDGDLRLPRAILNHFGIKSGLSMFLASEIPPGTGLGSSSSVAVAIIKAVGTAMGNTMSKHQLAEIACHIEIEKLGEPIGKQDQHAAAFGGLNWMEFTREEVLVEPLNVSPDVRMALEHNLLSFFTGSSRNASEILQRQTRNSKRQEASVIEALHRVKAMAYEVRQALEQGDLRTFGALLDENWAQKKRFASGITNPRIDQAYETAKDAGALGGKISGAGGGGFLLLYCEPDKQESVTRALDRHGFKRMDYRFDHTGARVLMNAGLNIRNIATSVVV